MLKNTIPFVDLRGKNPVDLLRAYPDKAQELVAASRHTYGLLSHMASFFALPFADRRSHAWLKEHKNPYLYEIESYAEILKVPGIYALNMSYEWGCTSGVFRTDESVSMLRVMDWPFPALGKHVMVVLQRGKAGDFYNITWPAVSGVFNAMAPGRFSASINLAPMRMHKRGLIGDWMKNRRIVQKESGLPPSHLLRQVFELAENYDEAKKMLSTTRIAVPSIFILAGTQPGQGCIIERLENTAEISELAARQQVTVSNHFNSSLARVGNGWRPREQDSMGRYRQSCAIHGHEFQAGNFEWLQAPMLNQFTRLCAITDARTSRLTLQGYEGMTAATEIFNLPNERYEQQQAV